MRTRRSQFSSNSMPKPAQQAEGHRTVLLHEAVESLALKKDDVVVDGTLGGAGHALAIARLLGPNGVLIGVDADHDAIRRASDLLADTHAQSDDARLGINHDSGPTVRLVHDNFRNIYAALLREGIPSIDKLILDLGWSSYQLSAGRGFSFLSDEPLIMSYANAQFLTAEIIVNDWEESSIVDVISGFGEERYARRIAREIVAARAIHRISQASELAAIVKRAVPSAYRFGRLHPATKTFQALRIAVNDELGAVESVLTDAWNMLRPRGRIAIISFHSIEDRIIKHRFAAWAREGVGTLITRKPIVPREEEIAENPRARSAKLRVIEKL
jgi:16S rRNA (cytosine1402-N4)-methyltransferase